MALYEWLSDEFDIPDLTGGSAEYGDDARLVAQGFLLPMLLGQAAPSGGRNNWEQPLSGWRSALTEAGYAEISTEPFADYRWAPAVSVEAR